MLAPIQYPVTRDAKVSICGVFRTFPACMAFKRSGVQLPHPPLDLRRVKGCLPVFANSDRTVRPVALESYPSRFRGCFRSKSSC